MTDADPDLSKVFWDGETREWRLTVLEIARTAYATLGRTAEAPIAVGGLIDETASADLSTVTPHPSQMSVWQWVRRTVTQPLTKDEVKKRDEIKAEIESVC